jgi:hypothetical protein
MGAIASVLVFAERLKVSTYVRRIVIPRNDAYRYVVIARELARSNRVRIASPVARNDDLTSFVTCQLTGSLIILVTTS